MIFKDFEPEDLTVLPEPPQSIRKSCHLCHMQSVSVLIFPKSRCKRFLNVRIRLRTRQNVSRNKT